MVGRPKKPNNVVRMKTNPGKRPAKKELKAESERPPQPKGLTTEQKKVWNDLVTDLDRLGVIARVDGMTLMAFVENFVLMRKMQRFVNKNGVSYKTFTKNGDLKFSKYPEVQILQECRRIHKSYLTEFGMTPASRNKLPDPNQGSLGFGGSAWDDYE